MTEESEKRKTIYDQDCQSYRYQDEKKWSRFKTIASIEGAILFGLFQASAITGFEKSLLLFLGSPLILIVALVSWKDQSDADSYMDRIREFEVDHPFSPRLPFPAGRYLMLVATIVILLANALLWCISALPH